MIGYICDFGSGVHLKCYADTKDLYIYICAHTTIACNYRETIICAYFMTNITTFLHSKGN